MSATAYDASPAPTQILAPSPTPNGRGPSNNRTLIIALAVVTLIALIAPILAFLLGRSSDESTQVDAGSELDAIVTPEPVTTDPATAPATTTDAPVAVAPTPMPAGAPAAPAAAPAAAPVVNQLAGDAPQVYKVTGVAAGSSLNVRQTAGTTNPLLGTIPGNATGIAGTGRRVSVDGSEWREIKFNNGTGWVFAGYLAIAPAPVAAAAPTAVPTPAAEVVKELAAESPAIYSVTGVSAGASLNVRAEPGRSQRLLGTLPADTAAITTTGRRALVGDVEWRQIGFRTGTAWVDASYLKLVPEAPKTVMLPDVAASTVAIVPLTSATDRLVLRAEPGYDKSAVGTVGASAVNITATGRTAQIETQIWSEITASGTTGWVPRQLTTPVAPSVTDVLLSSGVAAVSIDKVTVAEDGTVRLVIGNVTTTVAPTTTVATASGSQSSIADWAHVAKTGTTAVRAEVTVVGSQVTRIWVA